MVLHDEGTGSHMSVYANLMKGEFDDDLSWPFCGVIVIRLLNQFSNKYHIDHEVPFSRDVPNEISGRVIVADSGLGVPQFVSHNKLHYDRYSNVGYLKSDSIKLLYSQCEDCRSLEISFFCGVVCEQTHFVS